MPLKININSKSISDDARTAFTADVKLCFSVYSRLRQRAKIPASRIEVLLTDNFVADVKRLSQPIEDTEGVAFTVERIGGLVAGKNLPQTEDYSHVIIAFDAAQWRNNDQTGHSRLSELALVAHELAHPMIERARYASGALDNVTYPSITGGEVMRSVSRILAAEYRADSLADLVIRGVATTTIDGEVHPIGLWEAFGEGHSLALVESLQQAHPGWADTVQAYREWRMDLTTLWETIASSISQTLTLLMHVTAATDAAGLQDPLESEPFASLPAVKLYLAEPWSQLMSSVRRWPIVPPMSKIQECETEIVRVGESAIRGILDRLGLSIEERANREWALWVKEPMR